MSSRAGTDVARLRRLRRLAQRRGLSILAETRTNSKAQTGAFMLSEDESRRIVCGDKPRPYSASLDEIEQYLSDAGH